MPLYNPSAGGGASAPLTLTGTSNVKQLQVIAASGQSANILDITDSAGNANNGFNSNAHVLTPQLKLIGGGDSSALQSNGYQKWHLVDAGLRIVGSAGQGQGRLELMEQDTTPPAVTDGASLFSQDNGSGKTQLCVRFATGATQVVSTQP